MLPPPPPTLSHLADKWQDQEKRFKAGTLPQCPAGPCGKQLAGVPCPLGIAHPPTGTEHIIGCAKCAQVNAVKASRRAAGLL